MRAASASGAMAPLLGEQRLTSAMMKPPVRRSAGTGSAGGIREEEFRIWAEARRLTSPIRVLRRSRMSSRNVCTRCLR